MHINDASVIGSSAVTQPTPCVFTRSFTVQLCKTLTMKLSSFFSTASGSDSTGITFQWTDMSLKYNATKR